MDLTKAINLAKLPLAFWSVPEGSGGQAVRRELTPEERKLAAGQVDYLIVANWTHYMSDPGPLEAALRQNLGLADMASGAVIRLLMAPIPQPGGSLSVPELRPDLLDLTLTDRPLAIPLAPMNTTVAKNGVVGLEAAARAICPKASEGGLQECRSLLER
jgi:hypothetical protein